MKLLPDDWLHVMFLVLWIVIGILTLSAVVYRFFYG